MKYAKRILFFIILVFTIFSSTYSQSPLKINYPNYFGEEDRVFETIHYLENEILSFQLCSKDPKEIDIKATCENGKEYLIPYFENKNKKGCFYGNYNLNKIECDQFKLNVNYLEEKKERSQIREFKKEKESKLLNKILELNLDDLNPVEKSQYLYIFTEIYGKENKITSEIYEELKKERDNQQKCWPKNDCKIDQTLKIIENLKKSGYPKESRLISDGLEYLKSKILTDDQIEYNQNQIKKIWDVELSIDYQVPTGNTLDCDLSIDQGNEKRSYSFDENDNYNDKTISKISEQDINLTCDSDVDLIELRYFDEKINEQDESNENRVSYTLTTSNKEKYNNFNYLIITDNNYGNSSISCDIIKDGNTQTYTLDNSTSSENQRFEGSFSDSIEIDCNSNLDQINLKVFGGEYTKESVSNTNKIYKEFYSETDNQKFKTKAYVKYDLSKSQTTCQVFPDQDSGSQITIKKDNKDSRGYVEIGEFLISTKLTINCDDQFKEIKIEAFDKFNNKIIEEIKEKTSTNTLSLPNDFSTYSCLPENKDSKQCSFKNSILFLIASFDNFDTKSQFEKFILSFKKEDENNRKFIIDENKYSDSGKFLQYLDDKEIISNLKFTQNNEGSWGEEDEKKITNTAEVVLGLQKRETNSENIIDGKKWIYFNEPEEGWGNLEKNTLAYQAIKEQIKPYIIFNDKNKIISGEKFTIKNPTIYNIQRIKLDFSKEIKEYLSYKEDLNDLGPNSQINFTINVVPEFSGKKTGNLIIKGFKEKKEIELLNIPITIETPAPFKIEKNAIFYEGDLNTKIKYTINNSNEILTCNIFNPIEKIDEQITLIPEDKYFTISNTQEKEGEFEIELNCENLNEEKFTSKVKINIEKKIRTFQPIEKELRITDNKDFNIKIKNTFKDKQTITFQIEGDIKDIIKPAENSKIFAKNETRDVYFTILNKDIFNGLNKTIKGKIILSGGNYSTEIPVTIEKPIEEEKKGFPWLWTIIGIILIGFIVLVIKRYRELKLYEDEEENDQDELNLDEEIEFRE